MYTKPIINTIRLILFSMMYLSKVHSSAVLQQLHNTHTHHTYIHCVLYV